MLGRNYGAHRPRFYRRSGAPPSLPDRSVITLGFRPEGGDLVVFGTTKMARVTGLKLDALTHGDLPFEVRRSREAHLRQRNHR